MNIRLNLSSLLLIIGSWSLLFVSKSLAGCINDPGPPPIVCPIIEGHTGIQDCELNKYHVEALQCCMNPIDSSTWTTADWASYFGVHPIGGYDVDRKTHRYHEMAMDGGGNCSWVLRQDAPVDVSDVVHTRWVLGGSVDLTVPGYYFLYHEWYNEPVGQDELDCLLNFIDDPVTQTFVVKVIERTAEEAPLPGCIPIPGPWSDFVAPYGFFGCNSYEGEMRISNCFYVRLAYNPQLVSSCGEAVSLTIGATVSTGTNEGISSTWKEAIESALGISFQESESHPAIAYCSAINCLRRKVEFHQMVYEVEVEYEDVRRDIFCREIISRKPHQRSFLVNSTFILPRCVSFVNIQL